MHSRSQPRSRGSSEIIGNGRGVRSAPRCHADKGRPVNRTTSNTPLQALDLLNDPIYVEAARLFAEHALANGGKSFKTELEWIFDRALNRPPTGEERALLRGLYERNLKRFAANAAGAREFLTEGEGPPVNGDAVRLAAMATVTRAVMNLHELITRN